MLLVIWVLFIRWLCPIALLGLAIAIYRKRKERGFLWLAIAAGTAVATEGLRYLLLKFDIPIVSDPAAISLMSALGLPFLLMIVGAVLLLIDSKKEPIQPPETTRGN